MASDWLAAVPPANQMPDLKTLLTNMDFGLWLAGGCVASQSDAKFENLC